MPIVNISALPPDNLSQIRTTLAKVVSELAVALDTVPSNIWVNFIPMTTLQEGETIPDYLEYHPVISVLANPRPNEVIHKGMQVLATTIADGLGLKRDKIWIYWQDLPPGRVLADGEVR